MLINMSGPLKAAAEAKTALAAFNTYNALTIRSALRAGATEKSPVIIAFGASYLKFMSLDEVYGLCEFYSRRTGQDTVLHLDHCGAPEVVEKALNAGFTSVMIDGSRLPYDENLKLSSEIATMAHSYGATVEAELGSLAAGENSHEGEADDRERFTDPDQAAEFVRKSGIDALAVSIGTVHGMYKASPDIRIDILKEINKRVAVPLVLHGASGTPLEMIRSCVENGIRKINVNTEISRSVTDFIKTETRENSPHFSELTHGCSRVLEDAMSSFIRSFSSR